MEEIAAAAGTSKSIVYRYFADKTGLQIAVAEAVVLQIQGALEGVLRIAPTPRDGLRAMVAVYLEMIESSPNVYAFVTRNGSVESGGPLGHFLDSVTALVAAPFARGLTEEHDGRRTARRPDGAERRTTPRSPPASRSPSRGPPAPSASCAAPASGGWPTATSPPAPTVKSSPPRSPPGSGPDPSGSWPVTATARPTEESR